MKNGIFLTEALLNEKPQFITGRMNLFEAQTGQGKTTAATTTIPDLLKLNKQRCLILIDSIMGRDEKIELGLCQEWGEQLPDKPYIMTYAKFGSLVKNQQINQSMFDYIACDEIHNLIKYVRIDEAEIYKRNPESDYEIICLILSHESLSYIAIDSILRWMKLGTWTFAFTATPGNLTKWPELNNYIYRIQINEQLLAYQVLAKYEYTDLHALLAENPDTKRLIHIPTVELALSSATEIEQKTGRKVMVFWSKVHDKKMSDEQIKVLHFIKTEHKYPDELDDIIITEAYATGWNLMDNKVEEVIVHNGNKDVQIQVAGRKRGDWKIQWNYNSQKAEGEKRAKRLREQRARENQLIQNGDWVVPDIFLNRRLDKEDKEQLIRILKYPKKWTSLKKALEQNYNIRQVGSGAYYGHIIEIKNNN